MKIRKIPIQELANRVEREDNEEIIHHFEQYGYSYTITINKTKNIIILSKEDKKTEGFEIEFVEII